MLLRPVDWVTDIGHYFWQGSGSLIQKPALLYVNAADGATVQEVADASSLPDVEANVRRIVCLSDTHERHHVVQVPPASVLLHCGDILTINRHFTTEYSEHKLEDFASWLASLPIAEGKVFIGGNHDAALEALGAEAVCSLLHKHDGKIRYLEDGECEIGSAALRIWGSPVSYGSSSNNAFQTLPKERLSKIPPGRLDVLMTHGPVPDSIIKKLNPKLYVCGHIHNKYGLRMVGKTLCVNASIMDARYQPTHGAVVVDLPMDSM